MIKEKLDEYMSKSGSKQKFMWDYYSLNKAVIPVYQRKPFDILKAKTHTSVHVDYFGDIIGIKRGYIGEKIDFSHPDERVKELLKDMMVEADMQTTNSQTVEYSSVEGISHRICYTEDGVFKQKNVHGWQVIYEGDYKDPIRAYYFYTVGKDEFCDIYDNLYIYKYQLVKERNKKGEYVFVEQGEHNFNQVPVTPFLNNSNQFSNCDASIGLMDEYDAVLSDSIGEIKDLRRALLKIKGDVFTEQDSEGNPIPIPQSVAASSVIVFGPDMDGKSSGDAEYMTNNLNDDAITSTLNRIRGLIYETSGSVDLNLLSTGNAKTITEIKTTLLRLDNDAKTSESFLKMGLQKVLELWAYLVGITERVNIDTTQFEIKIDRRIPVDDAQRAELFLKLSSVLSIADSLRLAGYEDVEALAERSPMYDGIV